MSAGAWKCDAYAVSVIKHGTIVGHLHVPRRISCTCTLFMRMGGTISCQVTDRRKYSSDLQQRCYLIFDVENISRVKFSTLEAPMKYF